jgi:hypothetical protein
MTTFTIKILAIIFMIIDHIGMFFFPDLMVFRIIGRLSFPLFGWLIANGAYFSKNLSNYFYRLLFFALLSQIPFLLATRILDPQTHALNVFFTLALGLLAIICIKKTTMHIHWVIITVLVAILAQAINAEYGTFGVIMIVLFYLFFNNWKYLFITEAVLFGINAFLSLLLHQVLGGIGFFGLFSLGILSFYNRKPGPGMKYLFYLIYPLQYFIFYLVSKYIK